MFAQRAAAVALVLLLAPSAQAIRKIKAEDNDFFDDKIEAVKKQLPSSSSIPGARQLKAAQKAIGDQVNDFAAHPEQMLKAITDGMQQLDAVAKVATDVGMKELDVVAKKAADVSYRTLQEVGAKGKEALGKTNADVGSSGALEAAKSAAMSAKAQAGAALEKYAPIVSEEVSSLMEKAGPALQKAKEVGGPALSSLGEATMVAAQKAAEYARQTKEVVAPAVAKAAHTAREKLADATQTQ